MSDAVDRFLLGEIQKVAPSGRVLDLPAGDGNLSKLLSSKGYDVTPSDLFPESLQWEGHEAVLADMNAPLPFDDDSFDVVVSQEGVEHLENLPSFFRESCRVLKKGGTIWITTPNFMDLSGRLSYFLSGMKSFQAGFPNEEATLRGRDKERVYHGHAFSLPFFQIRYLLRVYGFGAVAVQGLKKSRLSSALYPIVRPVSGLLLGRAHRRLERKTPQFDKGRAPQPELQDELRRLAASRDLQCYRKICIRATKGAETPAVSQA